MSALKAATSSQGMVGHNTSQHSTAGGLAAFGLPPEERRGGGGSRDVPEHGSLPPAYASSPPGTWGHNSPRVKRWHSAGDAMEWHTFFPLRFTAEVYAKVKRS